MTDRGSALPGLAVWKAIGVGVLWVIVPVMTIILSLSLVPMALMYRPDVVVRLMLSGLAVGFVLAWVWWSVMVPRWRLWAYERVDDIAKLKWWAVAVGLTWPDGWIFERTEIKSKAHAARERELEARKPGDA